jgi:ribosomal protein L37AE/L43A
MEEQKPLDLRACEKCGKEYKIRISPGDWDSTICGCGCLVQYWTKNNEHNKSILRLLRTVQYGKSTFVPSYAFKRMLYVNEVQEKQVAKAGQMFGKK